MSTGSHRRSARRIGLATALVMVGLWAPSSARLPKRADVNLYGEGGLITFPRATLLGAGYYSFAAYLNYFYDGPQGLRASPVSFGLGLPADLEVAFSFSAMADNDPDRRGEPVQWQTSLKYRWLTEPKSWFAFATALRVENAFSLPDLTAMMVAEKYLGSNIGLIGVAGYRLSTDRSRRDDFIFGLGSEYRISRSGAAQVEMELDYAAAERQLGAVGRASLRWDVYKDVGLVLAVAGGFGPRSDLRITFGLRYRPSTTGLADEDEDGIPDERDACPEEPEDRDGFQDVDGCPDPDNDGDGIPDKLDSTPNGAYGGGLHSGPVRMRMRIPMGPIPTWIMGPDKDAPTRPKRLVLPRKRDATRRGERAPR